jgi:hypothetical protein
MLGLAPCRVVARAPAAAARRRATGQARPAATAAPSAPAKASPAAVVSTGVTPKAGMSVVPEGPTTTVPRPPRVSTTCRTPRSRNQRAARSADRTSVTRVPVRTSASVSFGQASQTPRQISSGSGDAGAGSSDRRGGCEGGEGLADPFRGHRPVRLGDDDDVVLARPGIDPDVGDARRAVDLLDPRDVDVVRAQRVQGHAAERVAADGADHEGRRPRPGRCDGLVGSLAAEHRGEPAADDGLTRSRQR